MSAPATHEELIASLDRIGDGVDALKKDNAELRAALRQIIDGAEGLEPFSWGAAIMIARAALAKVAP